MTPGQIQEVAKHYIIAALWADSPEGTNPRPTIKAQREAFDLCKQFIDRNLPLFNQAMACAQQGYGVHPDAGSAEAAFGHDLWLTTRGHGTGFWDRPELAAAGLGAALTAACREAGEPAYEFYRGWFHLHT